MSWTLLGLVIQRPSYGYELVQRFERTYGESIELSSHSQIYTALDGLLRWGLTEKVKPAQSSTKGFTRQPKLHYQATAAGVRAYERWLASQIADQRKRWRLLAQQTAALAPQAASRVLAQWERVSLKASEAAVPQGAAQTEPDEQAAQLADEADRLAIRATLDWVEFARHKLRLGKG